MKKVVAIALLVLLLAGCSGDYSYYVVAEKNFWSCNYTGRHAVMFGSRTVALVGSYAEADSICTVLNEGLEVKP